MSEIQISMLNHYEYCPKRAYICYVTNEFIDNEYTIEGKSIHSKVDSGLITKRKELLQIRSVWLKSDKYGLFGKSDLVEEKKAEIYPVEYKRGRSNDWKNDKIQLTAQAFCLEEMLNLEPIKKAYIYYHLSNEREEVIIDEKLREETILSIENCKKLFYEKTPDILFNKNVQIAVFIIFVCQKKQKV